MANNTRKILKELSDLTSNMDVLAKELKDSVKSNKEVAENVSNLTDNIEKDRTDSNRPDIVNHNKPEEKLFDNLTKSFEKIMSDSNEGIKDMVSKTMESSIPTNIAKVKADSKFSDIFKNNKIKDSISKAAKAIPGLEEGGEIEEEGSVIVGEGGPELVELEKGDNVRTIEQQMFEDELADNKKSKGVQNETVQESLNEIPDVKDEVMTDEPTLAIKDKSGPSENEINLERERLIKEDPSLKDDPDQLKDDVDYYVNEYNRETFTQEDVVKLNEPVNKNIETTDGIVTERKQKGGFLSKLAKKSKDLFKDITTDTKKASVESLSPELSMLTSSYLDTPETSNPTQTQELKSKNIKTLDKINREDSKQEMKTENAVLDRSVDALKPMVEKKQPAKNDDIEQETSKPKEASVNNSNNVTETNAPKEQRRKKKKDKPVEQVNPITAKDLQDIKSLLVAINRSLSSPLNIASDQPYRPETNQF